MKPIRFWWGLFGLLLAAQPLAATASTADHGKFRELQGPFTSGPEVTRACLACHTEAAKQVHRTRHWSWSYRQPATGQLLGKRNVVNNFCGSIVSNEPRCTSCHVGYGWEDPTFDFTSEENVDCLACHDTTGTYRKFPTDAGHPPYQDKTLGGQVWRTPDLAEVAQKVGVTGRENCGNCHFYGGGDDAVKHGDLDSSLNTPGRSLDVHMHAQGLDFSCATCHTSDNHRIAGSRYAVNAHDTHGIDIPGRDDGSRASCESCHGSSPHGREKLNDHTHRVACQTCHIPAFARGGVATKTWWDWSTAGRRNAEGKPFVRKDEQGRVVYDSKKGDFLWEENVAPEYFWFDGQMRYSGMTISGGEETLKLNHFEGRHGDPKARIWPFKVMRGRQPYDTVHKTLVVNHVFGKDDSAFWTHYDWNKAAAAGMAAAGLPFSGELGFVDTEMYWPITHMVAPKEQALGCDECHTRDGRLAHLSGFYLPGRDRSAWLDRIGWGAVLLVLLGSFGHAVARVVFKRGRKS